MNMQEYELVRTKRKTLALYVRQDGRVEVRAPLRTSKAYIDRFVDGKQEWITKIQSKLSMRQEAQKTIELTAAEVKKHKQQAEQLFHLKCEYFAHKMGVKYGTVKVNSAKTRWGSCNRKGDINLTYRLLFAPEELIDYVVVHELAHIREMNHSSRFWAVVEHTMPDYRERRKKLKAFQHEVELITV